MADSEVSSIGPQDWSNAAPEVHREGQDPLTPFVWPLTDTQYVIREGRPMIGLERLEEEPSSRMLEIEVGRSASPSPSYMLYLRSMQRAMRANRRVSLGTP